MDAPVNTIRKSPGFVRIASNYGRMAGTFVLGLWLVRLLLSFGSEAYAVIVLLIAGQSLAASLRMMAQASVVPCLGRAYHGESDHAFQRAYAASIVMCAATAVASAGIFGLFILALPWFRIPDSLLWASQCFVAAKAVQSCVGVATCPTFAMYMVTRRMGQYNLWMFLERASDVAAALLVLALMPVASQAGLIAAYGLTSTGLAVVAMVLPVLMIAAVNRRLIPSLRWIDRQSFAELFRSTAANSSVVVSNNLYFRVDALIMNAWLGLFGNLVFGVASQFVSYVRVSAMGLVTGLNADSARLAAQGDGRRVFDLLARATRTQAIVALPLAVVLGLLSAPLVNLWIGDRIADPATNLPPVITLVQLLMVGVAIRAIGESWIAILSGAGKLPNIARAMILAACANPLLVVILLWVLPQPVAYTAPAWAYVALTVLVYLGTIPAVLRTEYGGSWFDLFRPLFRPALAATICAPTLLLSRLKMPLPWAAPLLAMGGYGAGYAVAVWFYVLSTQERGRLLGMFARSQRREEISAVEQAPPPLRKSA